MTAPGGRLRPRARTTVWVTTALVMGTPTVFGQSPPPDTQPVLTLPPPPPDDTGVTVQQSTPAVDRAQVLLSTGHPAEAAELLSADLTERAVSPMSNDPAAVLLRLARSMVAHTAPTPPTAAAWGLPQPMVPQERVTLPLARTPVDPTTRSDGEAVTLYTTGALYGLGTGAWIDALGNIGDTRVVAWVPLTGGGLGILGAYALDNPTSMRRGRPTALNTGMLLGLSLGLSIGLWHDAHQDGSYVCTPGGVCTPGSSPWGGTGVATAAWLGATVGMGAGIGLAMLTDASPASGSFTLWGGLWGGTVGLMLGGAVQTQKDLGGFWVGGEVLGAGLALASAHALHPTPAQVWWMNLGVLGGGLLGGGLAALAYGNTGDGPAGPLLIVTAGMIGGGILGFVVGAPRDDSRGDGSLGWLQRHPVTPGMAALAGGAVFTLNVGNVL